MNEQSFDFYNRTNLKSYNLNESMRYQLNMLDQLDVFTRKHCENVASITCRLCEYLHCSQKTTEYCTVCAYLHDIGKQFIPPKILQKNGPLTDEEYEIMKTHTTIGYKMCMKDLKLRPYAPGPLYHHESLDGSGYPQGLTKKDIPYEIQIIKVADEYDAIVSKRQYKSHIGITDTLKIIIDQTIPKNNSKCGQVDPKIVRALIKVVLDDISFEISCTQNYVNSLKNELSRFNQIEIYKEKMDNSKNDKKKNYYLEGIKLLLRSNETLENYSEIYQEYKDAYSRRKAGIDNLYNEIKIIKKLKV